MINSKREMNSSAYQSEQLSYKEEKQKPRRNLQPNSNTTGPTGRKKERKRGKVRRCLMRLDSAPVTDFIGIYSF
jgi:hypothetical protein